MKLNIPKVKICCIGSIEEANMALDYGASAIGLVGPMPSGPGIIDDALIMKIAKELPKDIDGFMLTSETEASNIIAHHRRTQTNTIQLVDALKNETYQELRIALPNVKLVQVIHVIDESSVSEAIEKSQFVDVILLDSGNPNLKVKELGGTGRTHNWALSRKIVEAVDKPVYLAGGLDSTNIAEAILAVQPAGVDLCSGVRTDKKLDKLKLKAFFEAVNGLRSV